MKLQVWWIPQVPMDAFTVDVISVHEGVRILDMLARYDQFQYENSIKPDYCNTGGLNMWSDDIIDGKTEGWIDWYDEETGVDDPYEYIESGNP